MLLRAFAKKSINPAFIGGFRGFAMKNYVEMSKAEEWDNFIAEKEEPIVLQAGATWCGPCNFLKPRLLKVGEEFDD